MCMKSKTLVCSPEVLIIGGGIAGLAVANVLESQNISYMIVERRSELSDEGAGLILWNNALLALTKIIGRDYLSDVQSLISKIQIHDRNNRYLTEVPVNDFAKDIEGKVIPGAIAVERNQLISWLSKAIPKDKMLFDQNLVSIVPDKSNHGISIQLESGLLFKVKYLVCADGVRSTSRELIGNPPQLFNARHSIYRGLAKLTTLENSLSKEAVSKTFLNNGSYFMYHKTISGRVYWALSYKNVDGKIELESLLKKFPTIASEIVKQTDIDSIVHNSVFRHTKTDFCSLHSNILYTGDAAHATSPQMGQGAGMALEDAAFLSKALKRFAMDKELRIENSFQSLKEHRENRTNFVINRSHLLSQRYHLSSRILCLFRDWILSKASPAKMKNLLSPVVVTEDP